MQTTAKTAEDIIGIVPHTLGYIPRESLVAIIVGTDEHGTQTCATTLRVDFDLESAAHIVAEGGQWYSELITGACTATGVFLVLYDSQYQRGIPDASRTAVDEHDDEYPRVHRELIRAAIDEIALSLGDRGIDTLSAWWVSEERFGRIDDDAQISTRIEAAATSTCATELVAAGSSPVASPQELVVRPVSADEFSMSRNGHRDMWLSIGEAFDILSELYPLLARLREGDEGIDRAAVSELMTLRTVMAIDAILCEKWSRDALEMILSFDHPDFAPADIEMCGPGQLHLRAQRYGTSPQAAQQMVGLSPRAPRPRDVQLGIEFLKTYIPLGHPDVRPTAYAVIAWFEWSLGGSTMAEHYAQAGLDLDANNAMATLIRNAVEQGYLPRWLMSARRGPG
ncbi:MAG: DUF4192 domain-containing protein [Brevibacterium sp.]|uniref:DUF4192 family protein n=1 Tax=Brevibacterium sp. TaxID=1701 RepID=UPI0026483BCC|nr:DUF4192 family protein [Brevibacterium sp.]MDN5805867.1 DUF4192 domain-containing protein [Brevibacterium sp.]MDN6134128.1 DUF4192 domain-containing protein [Brevibacterium sp.]MDN6175073.1 DUF4192 domain-containing protein [Brevibacterium sp.]MDN6187875.1 DUF4192 domain-containing protein [Brevibacterium sp.]MDN6190863.1 DUF4192 domain-containing protein [Brevibacterium sp.]